MCFSDFNEVVHHFLYVAWLFFIIKQLETSISY